MAWSVTINGNTYTDTDFEPFGYVTNFPAIIADLAAVAEGIANAADGNIPGNAAIGGTLVLSGDISPSQITSNQDDYNPTGLSSAFVLRITADAIRNITGLQGGADGRIVILMNVGSRPIVLVNDATSTAANRFLFGFDYLLYPSKSIAIIYDATSARWRPLSESTRPWTLVTITATDAAWPIPAGTSEYIALVHGAGGSGAGAALSSSQRRGGGGGGAGSWKHYKGIMDAALAATIGAGGTAVTADTGGTPGNTGGTTTLFGTNLGTITCTGGQGCPNSGAGGTGGSASGGDINMTGEAGSVQPVAVASGCGEGGSAPLWGGFGGRSNIGTAGGIPGGGGSCSNHTSSGDASGAGARGEIKIWYR